MRKGEKPETGNRKPETGDRNGANVNDECGTTNDEGETGNRIRFNQGVESRTSVRTCFSQAHRQSSERGAFAEVRYWISINPSADPRELPSYGITEAAHYLRLPTATLRSWLRGRYYPTETGADISNLWSICGIRGWRRCHL